MLRNMLRMKKIYFTNPDIIFNKLRNIFYFVLIMADSPFNNLSPLIVQLLNIYIIFWFIDWFFVFNATFSYIIATSFSGGRSWSAQREPPTMGKQLVNFITCGCESSAPFFCNLQSRVLTHTVLVIGLYELLDNPTT